MHQRRRAVVKWMGQRDIRVNPFQSEVRQRQRFKKRRTDSHRMNCRAHIMMKARQRQFLSPRASSRLGMTFHDQHPTPRLCERNRRPQPVWPRADNCRIVVSMAR